jgi:ribosome-binding protein aMBF1 (putative translation factor)
VTPQRPFPRFATSGPAAAKEAADCGRVLRELRQLKDVSVAELAARTGLDERIVAEFESGSVIPPQREFETYLRALGYGSARRSAEGGGVVRHQHPERPRW